VLPSSVGTLGPGDAAVLGAALPAAVAAALGAVPVDGAVLAPLLEHAPTTIAAVAASAITPRILIP
jgi:hypothetical protein